MKVFLGGTCNGEDYRKILIPKLTCTYFNPVVEDWTPECKKIEDREKEICDYHLYVITKDMIGPYSVAELIDDSNKIKGKTVVCILYNEMKEFLIKSLRAVEDMAQSNGATVVHSLDEAATYLNTMNNYDKEPTDYYSEHPILVGEKGFNYHGM